VRKRARGEVLDHHGDPTHAWRYSVKGLGALLAATGWATNALELRAYKARLRGLERAVVEGKWGPSQAAQAHLVTDWDGIHSPEREE
jgi:hypothetical protein